MVYNLQLFIYLLFNSLQRNEKNSMEFQHHILFTFMIFFQILNKNIEIINNKSINLYVHLQIKIRYLSDRIHIYTYHYTP